MTKNNETAPQNAEALEAFERLKVLIKNLSNKFIFEGEVMTEFYCEDTEIIEAALNQPRTVKPLVWVEDEKFLEASSPLGVALVYQTKNNNWGAIFNNDHLGFFKSEDEAKAAAEAHYKAKIGECLEPAPKIDGLREAIEMCEGPHASFILGGPAHTKVIQAARAQLAAQEGG